MGVIDTATLNFSGNNQMWSKRTEDISNFPELDFFTIQFLEQNGFKRHIFLPDGKSGI